MHWYRKRYHKTILSILRQLVVVSVDYDIVMICYDVVYDIVMTINDIVYDIVLY